MPAIVGGTERLRHRPAVPASLPDGRLGRGTMTDGVEIADPERGSVRQLPADPARPGDALPPDVAVALAPAPDGDVFVGRLRGLCRARGDAGAVRRVAWPGHDPALGVSELLREAVPVVADPARPLTDRRVTALARGPGGALWIGTRNGLNRLPADGGPVQRIAPGPGPGGGLRHGPAGRPAAAAVGGPLRRRRAPSRRRAR